MKAQIIQIGNSQGIRIPKMMLEESGMSGEVDLELLPDGIFIRNTQSPRSGWDEAFKLMADSEDGELEEAPGPSTYDKNGWQW